MQTECIPSAPSKSDEEAPRHLVSNARKKAPVTVVEYLLRFLVIVVAVVLGGITALIIGFAAGWIGFAC